MKTTKLLLTLMLSVFTSALFANTEDIYGIDISHYQGKINWKDVSHWNGKKLHFVYIKATEGATLVDKNYHQNLHGASEQNLLVGSYHYFKTKSTPKAQFENFKKIAIKEKQKMRPIVDVEERGKISAKLFHANLKQFISMVENHYGCKPLLYTSNTFYNKYLNGKYKDYKFIIGRYSKNQPCLNDKHNYCMWQFSQSAIVKGIPTKVDLNILHDEYTLEDIMMQASN